MSRRKQARPIRHLEEEGAIADGAGPAAATAAAVVAVAATLQPVHGEFDLDGIIEPDELKAAASVLSIAENKFRIDQNNGESSASCSEEDVCCAEPADLVTSGALEGTPLMCARCQEQFTEVTEFLAHKVQCDKKAQRHHDPAHSDPEDMVVSEYEDEEEEVEDEETGVKRLEQVRRHRQDAANNNSTSAAEEDGEPTATSAESEALRIAAGFPFPLAAAAAAAAPASANHVTLEALQNTKVAVAQFAATAMANSANSEAALQELAVLQSTLFTLQHQQVFQLQLINQLQQQLSINRPKDGSGPPSPSESGAERAPGDEECIAAVESCEEVEGTPREASSPAAVILPPPPAPQTLLHHHQQISIPVSQPLSQTSEQMPVDSAVAAAAAAAAAELISNTPLQPPHCSISSSLAASIITNNDPPPSLDEPNTLEMLQKRAQEVLDSASQGLLANNLADELAFRKHKGSMSPYDSKSGRNEPFFKHRCRYCGKVFGSDSALQIHIRSHTGERPFKCNVCGSRFTTKGNLKVHFQRHTAKFPHIKMNPNPVPEHLDKYHPPLLAQLGQNPALSPGHHGPPPPPPPPHPFAAGSFAGAGMPLYRAPVAPPPQPPTHDLLGNVSGRLQPSPQRDLGVGARLMPHLFGGPRRDEQDAPENLSKPAAPRSPPPAAVAPDARLKTEPADDRPPAEELKIPHFGSLVPKQEQMDMETDGEPERYGSPVPYDDMDSMDSKYSGGGDDMMLTRSPGPQSPAPRSPNPGASENDHHQMQDEPENLSNKVGSVTAPLTISTGQRLPASFNFSHGSSPPSSASSGSLGPFSAPSLTDPAKDPAVYTSLLPRPGSNDNSWESLIEVTKTSETSKLQQLVDNIEHKLTDPNQCVICHRVLSCKSALQMHYRTHTGERPFKCKICGRAFTTKGNLKTHMGVHRAKPPMRVLHQCPVCHKKFTNALVLQQHIRLHTGEPTDLTPEQIQAAEIKDFPSPGGAAFSALGSMSPFLPQAFLPGGLPMGLKHHELEHLGAMKHEHDAVYEEDEEDDDDMSNADQQMPPSFSTSLAALENQVRTITTMASQLSSGYGAGAAEDLRAAAVAAAAGSSTPTHTPPHNGDKSPARSGLTSPSGSELRSSPNQMPVQIPRPPSSQQLASPAPSDSNSLGALDLTPRGSQQSQPGPPPSPGPGPSPGPPPMLPSFGLLPPGPGSSPLMSSALSSLTSSVLTSTAFSPLGLAVGPGVRGNTTCNICFKTFACNSALEIHYRSHTKERPFKCTVCDRGFSTKNSPDCTCAQGQRRIQDGGGQKPRRVRKKKPPSAAPKNVSAKLPPLLLSPGYATACEWNPFLGNMKQHMLTHKIRDMPPHMFDKPPSVPSSIGEESQSSTAACAPPPREPHDLGPPEPPLPPPPELPLKPDTSVKRSTSEAELPVPKRPPNVQSSKHLCHVCNKNFSSSSALQIHMRTHTGDKPFRCTVCQKAFTTKGNLKVHMGTHMWSNGASRRGRRMSLDLPPIPMTPKDSEFLQRRPDLFYPYLPAPFLNGMQQKLNEISVIQNASNGLPNSGKYTGLLGFGYPPPDGMRPQSESPLSEKPTSRPPSRGEPGDRDAGRDVLPRMWDLHYERSKAAADQAMEVDTMPPGVPSQPPPLGLPAGASRGEGLAA